MPQAYIYVVDRDFGFAPNPFHGTCTLATCKPQIRKAAQINDWVIGMGGVKKLRARGRCVYAMRISRKLSYNEYWYSPEFFDKRPVRNGSYKMLVGDNIYHRESNSDEWVQEDSHHSNFDGTPNLANVQADTKSDQVLISEHFYYFGSAAPIVPNEILTSLGFENRRGHRKFSCFECIDIIGWLESNFVQQLNNVVADPYNFDVSGGRYSPEHNRVIFYPNA